MHPDMLTDPICQMDLRGIEPLSKDTTNAEPLRRYYSKPPSPPLHSSVYGELPMRLSFKIHRILTLPTCCISCD